MKVHILAGLAAGLIAVAFNASISFAQMKNNEPITAVIDIPETPTHPATQLIITEYSGNDAVQVMHDTLLNAHIQPHGELIISADSKEAVVAAQDALHKRPDIEPPLFFPYGDLAVYNRSKTALEKVSDYVTEDPASFIYATALTATGSTTWLHNSHYGLGTKSTGFLFHAFLNYTLGRNPNLWNRGVQFNRSLLSDLLIKLKIATPFTAQNKQHALEIAANFGMSYLINGTFKAIVAWDKFAEVFGSSGTYLGITGIVMSKTLSGLGWNQKFLSWDEREAQGLPRPVSKDFVKRFAQFKSFVLEPFTAGIYSGTETPQFWIAAGALAANGILGAVVYYKGDQIIEKVKASATLQKAFQITESEVNRFRTELHSIFEKIDEWNMTYKLRTGKACPYILSLGI